MNSNDWKQKLKALIAMKEFKFAVVGVAILAVLGIIINRTNSSSISNQETKGVETTQETTEGEVDTEEQARNTIIEADSLTTLKLGGIEISSELDVDLAADLEMLQDGLDKAYQRNALIFLIMGETDDDRVAQIYNKDYQTYCEWPSDYLQIYYDRGKSLQITDKVERVQDITALDTLQGVLDLAKANTEGVMIEVHTHDIYESDLIADSSDFTDDEDDIIESIEEVETEAEEEVQESTEGSTEESDNGEANSSEDVESTEDVEAEHGHGPDDTYLYTQKNIDITITQKAMDEYYKLFGDIYNNGMQKEAWEQLSENDNTEDDYLVYSFVTTNLDDTFGAGEYVVIDGTDYISWYFDTYYALNDWSMDKEAFEREGTVQEYVDTVKLLQDKVAEISVQLQQSLENRMAEVESMSEEMKENTAVSALESAGSEIINNAQERLIADNKVEDSTDESTEE